MIYSLFLYQSKSGLLLYDKNFQDVSDGKLEMFSAFFSALKSFISEMVLSGSKELKNIELGDYLVLITLIPEIKSDLVIIADKEDNKTINKLIPKIVKVILNYKELFISWDQSVKTFKILDQPLTELILSKKKLVEGTSLTEKQNVVLKSIWAHKKDLSAEIKQNLIAEKEILQKKLLTTENFHKKLILAEKLIEISEKLKDDKDFIKYQKDAKIIKDEISDRKLKLAYYLERSKESLSYTLDNLGSKSLKDGDYKETYLNLYSFSSKLKNVTDSETYKKYQLLAKKLIDKEQIPVDELSQVISEILAMKDDINVYLK
ncbi:MAG: hypothetical protein EU532_00725 [Promethearchaeota archaeon]|nr:MAG: hypothetical protein EU532_00725 [Candidatus Lokiarchaeota archaeon]